MISYYSKWRKKWIRFKQEPTSGQLVQLSKYNYRIKNGNTEVSIDSLIK